jgi:hypothetical protein
MTTTTTRFADGTQRLGLAPPDVAELARLHEAGDCAPLRQRMAELVAARLDQVQSQLGSVLAEQAAAGGLGAGAATEPLRDSIGLAKSAGRLQAAARILATEPATVACTDDCGCSRAAAVTEGPYVFPSRDDATPEAEGQPIVCTLEADGGDLAGRVGEWDRILGQATGREMIPEGVAVTFTHDVARTGELARLLAAEYSCCSFASYHLTIDARGVRMEIHTPEEGRETLAAMFGSGS